MSDLIGKTISHYKILAKIGQGGMGVVYKAEDTNLKRIVALKRLLPEAMGTDADKERFLREARAAASLDHPNICTIHEIDELDGMRFMAMAYVEGQSLRSMVLERPLEIAQAVEIAIQIAEGLLEAHEKGIVHRDMKSDNVMITPKGQVKIMDFGLAKQAGQALLTKEGASMGTTAYMSPEQTRGNEVDHRTDIWSFGVILYEMIAGQLPFRGEYEQAVIYSILNESPEPLTAIRSGVPMDIERIANKTMAKNSGERYQRMDDLLIDLKAVQRSHEPAKTSSHVSQPTATSFPTDTRREKVHAASPADEPDESGVTFVQDLLQRRVPQIVGFYMAASFGVVQFIDWLVKNYPISPYLPHFSFVALASMIPTVILLAYFHGKPGRDNWTKFEKFGIPLNLVAAALLLMVIFQDKELGAATQKVTITDEAGKTVQRSIPKAAFRKRIALFRLTNESKDSEVDWLSYGLPAMLEYDLDQDILMGPDFAYWSELRQAGYNDPAVAAPLTLMQRIANEDHMTFFAAGSFRESNGQITTTTQLYESKNAKLVDEITLSGSDPFDIIDSLAVRIKQGLKIPAYHLEQVTDLPVAEISTHSMEAFRLFSSGLMVKMRESDYDSEADYLEAAVKEDPTFALAHYRLNNACMVLNRRDRAEEAIIAAMDHKHKLPTKYLLTIKHYYFNIKNQPQQVLDNALNWVKLYPESAEGYHVLTNIYTNRNQIDKAIENHRQYYITDPEAHGELLHIGTAYKIKGDFDAALKSYQAYAEKFPEEAGVFQTIGDLHQITGDYEAAKASYNHALLIEPESISLLTSLAGVEINLGNFDAALEQYNRSLARSDSPQDSNSVYLGMVDYYRMKGQIRDALKAYDMVMTTASKFQPPLAILGPRFQSMALLAQIGRQNEAFRLLGELEKEQLVPPFDLFPSLGYLILYLELEDADNAEEYTKKFEDFIDASGLNVLEGILYFAQGSVHELRKEFDAALPLFEKAAEKIQADQQTVFKIPLAECLRKKGDIGRSEDILEEVLQIRPHIPLALYQMALVQEAGGDRDRASHFLRKALMVWKDADEDFKYSNLAQEKAKEWGIDSSN